MVCHQLLLQKLDGSLLSGLPVHAKSYLSLATLTQQLSYFVELRELCLLKYDKIGGFDGKPATAALLSIGWLLARYCLGC